LAIGYIIYYWYQLSAMQISVTKINVERKVEHLNEVIYQISVITIGTVLADSMLFNFRYCNIANSISVQHGFCITLPRQPIRFI